MLAADRTNVATTRAADGTQLLPRALQVGLWGLACAIVAGWLVLVGLHLHDDYRVRHTQGVWMAVAEEARQGRLYPPVFDGEHYAGTRYMPLAILMNGLASEIAGDPLTGGKALAAGLMTTLLVLVLVLLRRFACPWPVAVALTAVVVATETGLHAGTTIGGDLLPVVLQVAALAVACATGGTAAMLAAGGLAGLAIASKLTGFWAWLAVTTWLVLRRRWRCAGAFTAACAGTALMILGTVQLVTHGGLIEHLTAFSVAGVHTAMSLLRGPNQILYNILTFAAGAVVLLPVAMLGVMLSRARRDVAVVHLALGYALLLLLVVYADAGTGFNQLLDLVVLTVLAVGHLAGQASKSADGRTPAILVLVAALAAGWAAGLDLVRTVGFELRRPAGGEATGRARLAHVIADLVRPGEEVLAEDPSIYVALGRRPVVMDPFMIRRLDRSDPSRVDPLISRITSRRFALVVLVVPLEDRSLDYWWTDFHYGPRVAEALRTAYVFERRIGRLHLYRPRFEQRTGSGSA